MLDVEALRATGAAMMYDWTERRGVLALSADACVPTMREATALFERLDPRCLRVVVVDGDGILADYTRPILPWWSGPDTGPVH